MSKTIVEMQRTWGRYVKGDIAGFEAGQAKQLTDAKPPIAKPFKGEVKKPAPAAGDEAGLTKRAAELDAREKELAAREEEIAKANVKPAGDQAGQPPKQGGK